MAHHGWALKLWHPDGRTQERHLSPRSGRHARAHAELALDLEEPLRWIAGRDVTGAWWGYPTGSNKRCARLLPETLPMSGEQEVHAGRVPE